jgi:hypothetical protein
VSTTPDVTLGGTASDVQPSQFGCSVAGLGDADGDGLADVIVGACVADDAWVFAGNVDAHQIALLPNLLSGSGSGSFGQSVAAAGDVDGDGRADAIVGAPSMLTGSGAVYVFHDFARGLATSSRTQISGIPSVDMRAGDAVAGAGDTDGDGYDDVLVGVPTSGHARLYFGAAVPATSMVAPDFTLDTRYGDSLAALGDLDGDHRSDFAVGASQGAASAGVVGIYAGRMNRAYPATPDRTLASPTGAGTNFGTSVATAR